MNQESLKSILQEKLKDHLIVFVAKDFSRGIGIEHLTPNYLIICGTACDAIDMARADNIDIFCLEEHQDKDANNAGKILESRLSQNYIKKIQKEKGCTQVSIFSFKGTAKIEFICKKNNWNYLNLSAKQTNNLEEKANFEKFIKNYTGPKLQTLSGKLKDLDLQDLNTIPSSNSSKKFAVQTTHGFAGMTTSFLNQEEFLQLQKKHPENKVKITPFVTGETLTLNGCIYNNQAYISYPFLQKTGLPEYSRHPGGSCGVIFDTEKTLQTLSATIENPQEITSKTIKASRELAEIFKNHQLRGFFGFDLITNGQEIYPIEINPRLTANIHPFTVQQDSRNLPPFLLLHILEFLNIQIPISKPENYLHPLKGETTALRNVTDTPIILNQDKLTNGYSFKQLLENPVLKEIFTPNKNGSTINPDERWAEIWSI